MNLFEELIQGKASLSVVGLGYVGLPLVVAFAKKVKVVGFDRNRKKINLFKKGIDKTNEVSYEELLETTVEFTADEKYLEKCKFHIVAVPTPINKDNTPNLDALISASETIGKNLKKGSIVVYESTVYPGVTEEVCKPILEKYSGLICGKDFKIGYSPERINPGDEEHSLENIVKIVSGMDDVSLDEIAKIYELIIDAGVYRAESIKIAEAAKVIENAQRDINIAFMNELSIIFNKLEIDTKAILRAASTKWNFMNFTPGLVGGHCIGVDPYYLTYKAQEIGYHSQIILAGRKINDYMGKYVAENTVKMFIKANKQINGSRVAVMGITFKENSRDVRNSKVIDLIDELKEYGAVVEVVDPLADIDDVEKIYNKKLNDIKNIKEMDAVIFAVAHDEFKFMRLDEIKKMYRGENHVLIDIKGIFDKEEAEKLSYQYWRL